MSCTQPGARVSLDGQPLVSCPGSEQRRLVPGPHQVVGSKDGFLTQTRDLVLLPGKAATVAVELVPLQEAAVITHRWAVWKPWAVVGGGVVVAGLGGLVQLRARTDLQRYEDAFGRECAQGCTVDPVADLKATAVLENRIAIGMVAAGAATVIGGVVLVVMNRGRTSYPDARGARLGVTPLPGGGATISVGVRYCRA